jgi:glutaredoxin
MEWSRPEASAMSRLITTCLLTVASFASAAPTLAQTQLYRYIDPTGRVVYSDQPPPPTAKGVQPKRLQENVIQTDPVPLAAREAAERNPVTLYTFDCEVCKQAEELLAKRGVPFTRVIVSEEEGAAKLKTLTGKQTAPVLQIGEKQVMVGFNDNRWQSMLDDAGYPKSLPPAAARQAGTRPAATERAPAKPPPDVAPPPPAGPGTDYPK